MAVTAPHEGFITLLKKRDFLRLWLAQLISMTILNASNYALLVLIEEVTGSTTLVAVAMRDLNRHMTSITVVALLGTIWSGQAVFGAIRTALNQAWGVHETRSFWVQRRLEVTLAVVVGLLFVLSSLVT